MEKEDQKGVPREKEKETTGLRDLEKGNLETREVSIR